MTDRSALFSGKNNETSFDTKPNMTRKIIFRIYQM